MDSERRPKRVRYGEGQWFAVPVEQNRYALGIIVRGNFGTKGGLGYFFGPAYPSVPEPEATRGKKPADAVLITWFGDLGIISGEWPLVGAVSDFRRQLWPVPKFFRPDLLNPGKGWLVEYPQDPDGAPRRSIRETYCEIKGRQDLPEDGLSGYKLVETQLKRMLANSAALR